MFDDSLLLPLTRRSVLGGVGALALAVGLDLALPPEAMAASGDLWFVKTKSTGSGKVEVHTATAASGYKDANLHAITWFSTAEANHGWFQMVGNDLYFIKTKKTGSGKVEVHTATAASGYKDANLHAITWFSTAEANHGWFQMVGNDLYFIKTKKTGSGKVEVHTATAASGYRDANLHAITWFSTAEANHGWFQMVGNDLYVIKTKKTGSGKVEVHTATAASGYKDANLHAITWFSTAEANHGWFQMVGNDLYFIKTKKTGSGKVEVHCATSPSGYKSASIHAITWFSPGEANNGTFEVDSTTATPPPPSGPTDAIDAFVSKYSGRFVDYDGAYGAQCVDLFNFYNRDLVGASFAHVAYAYQLLGTHDSSKYTVVEAGQTANRGDVAVWSSTLPGSGGAGHVAIVLADGGGSIQVFDQNSPVGAPCAVHTHSKSYLSGYLRRI